MKEKKKIELNDVYLCITVWGILARYLNENQRKLGVKFGEGNSRSNIIIRDGYEERKNLVTIKPLLGDESFANQIISVEAPYIDTLQLLVHPDAEKKLLPKLEKVLEKAKLV